MRLQTALSPIDMPTDASERPRKCGSTRSSAGVPLDSLDTGTQMPIAVSLKDLLNPRKGANIGVTTLGGDIGYDEAGSHRIYGVDTAVDESADNSLFNFKDLEAKYSVSRVIF